MCKNKKINFGEIASKTHITDQKEHKNNNNLMFLLEAAVDARRAYTAQLEVTGKQVVRTLARVLYR